jgi:hypothetical protein
MGSQQMRIAALVLVAAVVGVVLWLVLHHSKSGKPTDGNRVVIQKLVSPSGLKFESRSLGKTIYWAGPKAGVKYEFTEEKNGSLFVRYLTHGAKKGVRAANYLIVATYKFPDAYSRLKKLANAKTVSGPLTGPDGSIIYVRPHDQKSVLMAWPKVNYEVEIYDPSPTQARQVASSGDVKPVR